MTDAPSESSHDLAPLSGLGPLENIKVKLAVEVGRTEMTIRDILNLKEGSVVELEQLAGDPLDILVNGTPIARGEVVVAGERYGIRFSSIVDPADRVATG
ncbi:flagellar motor switch protein FliN/FliY [Rhodovulum bhavnagarense]|uniref:Flagellar motor switch protein FliN n=1 Tax=Rhodovulum bhavnagarense TaxID=992286 RepID=A0A4V2SW80_9RHOB|nr:flagellar motor switch protein FliN [Rhodovulum bhavnagarense]TCP61386.1 flagellar motor switch protein FliN/FliY [Rhodovulum bhavnagarense]